MNSRKSGILLHPTSLPGKYGIGDLGPEAENFLYFLRDTYTSIWQILPVHPPGYGNSPYTAYSAFAGNELFVSPDILVEEGFLDEADTAAYPYMDPGVVDFESVRQNKQRLFQKAFANFNSKNMAPVKSITSFFLKLDSEQDQEVHKNVSATGNLSDVQDDFAEFCQLDFVRNWLNDYALFRTIKEKNDQKSWNEWPVALRNRHQKEMDQVLNKHEQDWNFQRFLQYLFFRQWLRLKQKADQLGIVFLGDIPIFVSYDSAEVWAHQSYFHLTKEGNPKAVAGVPPDYFSETGQLWGNPLYNWPEMKKDNYLWWENRLKTLSALVDWIRIDHFRGFEAFWEVPAKETTAINGKWKKGPGRHFFKTILKNIRIKKIVAEDLGVITSDVEKLRDEFAFPGMKVLQFAFGGAADNIYLPHNHVSNCVVYTGTHDNDTTTGWFHNAPEHVTKHVRDYFGIDGSNIAHYLMRVAMMSVADTMIFPLQDLLQKDSSHRMNTPATATGNWGWRMQWEDMDSNLAVFLSELNTLSNRKPIN